MGLKSTVRASASYRLTGAPDLGNAVAQFDGLADVELSNGTGSGQADVVFSDTVTIAASGTLELDLRGSMVNPIGGAAVFAKVKAIVVKARAGNTNNVVVGGAVSNPFVGPFGAVEDTIAVPPGGALVLLAPAAGWAVGAGASDILKFANSSSGTGVTFDLLIIGTSA